MDGEILNRGVEIRKHMGTGAEIYMVCKEPGIYYNGASQRVSDSMAAEAGFPVEQHQKERRKAEAMAAAHSAIEAQYAGVEAKSDVIKERRGFKMIDIGMDRYTIHDPDGNNLTPRYISPTIADKVFDQLVPPEAGEAPADMEVGQPSQQTEGLMKRMSDVPPPPKVVKEGVRSREYVLDGVPTA